MRLHVAAIGKLKPGAEKQLAEDYQTRISQIARKAGVSGITVSEQPESVKPTAAQRMTEEAATLRKHIPRDAALIILDERGSSLTSEDFAKLLRKHFDHGTSDIALLIGGPDGHDPGLRKAATTAIALGSMTWPHRLVRIMILEQIYRAFTIMLNHPYHRA
jgi:23S rRNA (pseudouridine1915-N3)-methyltransferase